MRIPSALPRSPRPKLAWTRRVGLRVSLSLGLPLGLLVGLAGCLDRELVPLDAAVDGTTAPDARADAPPSPCGDACDAAHCVDGECVECIEATVSEDCPSPTRAACVENVCAACDAPADCERFTDTPACATSGERAGECVACAADADCDDPTAARCDPATHTCVACEASSQCMRFEGTPFCATSGDRVGECVACAADADCTDPEAAHCEPTTGTCVPCDDDDHCAGTGQNVCVAGTCFECREDSAATHCGDNSCDPVAFACTTTPRDSLGSCQPCLSDAECFGDAACVPLRFEGAERGFYCLNRPPVGGCASSSPPYRVPVADRVSRSNAPSTSYCGINEDLTTCEAVREAGEPCVEGSDACGPGGLCAFVGPAGAGSFTCTYACSLNVECRATGPLSLCTDLPGDDYCGRR